LEEGVLLENGFLKEQNCREKVLAVRRQTQRGDTLKCTKALAWEEGYTHLRERKKGILDRGETFIQIIPYSRGRERGGGR